uniref:Histone-lysine N-methyltransferase n=1 Tax=Hyaloperonospora arabidopsidis (strain Emoy2) TaxID=559515 RepID=M4B835_HYAAE
MASSSERSANFDHLQALRNVQLITRNEYPLRHLARERVRQRARQDGDDDDEDDDERALCFCTFPDPLERLDKDTRRCDDVSCLNFATYIECSPCCATGEFCRNQRLQHPERFPLLEPFKTEFKGYGVRTREVIAQRGIVGEYVGEIIDQKELARRLKSVPRHELNFYYLLLAPGVYIDARTKGSFTRFVNHSCEPNCKTEKWTVKGETRIAVIALRDIDVGEELTFDYQWKALGSRQIKCFCGMPTCKGVIGLQNDTLQGAEAQTGGYFRDPERHEIGLALVGRRVRVFLSPDDKMEFDVHLVKAHNEDEDRYEVEDLLELTGYETDEKDIEEDVETAEKHFVQLKENGWQIYCPVGDEKGTSVFAIPKKRVPTSSEMSSADGSRDPSPKRAVTSQSPVGTPSLVAWERSESSFSTIKKSQYGETTDRDGKVVSNKLLIKFLPKEYDVLALRGLFLSRKHPNALVHADVFNFLDGSGWALVELESCEVASSFRRTLDRRNLLDKMLRVYQAGVNELENFRHQKSKVQMMRQQGMTIRGITMPFGRNRE